MGNITGRPTVAASGLNAYLASNDADEQIDLSMTDSLSVLIDNTNAATITDVSTTYNFSRNMLFVVSDDSPAPTAAITLTIPSTKRGVFVVKNVTSFDVTVTISGQADTPDAVSAGTSSVFSSDGTNVRIAGGGGGASDFISLTDVDEPDYTGHAGQGVRVNSTPDGLEFYDQTLLGLSDAPSSFSGQAGKALIVNPGETATEFGAVAGSSGDALPFTLSPAARGALVKPASNDSGNFTTTYSVPMDEELYDTDGFHDNVTNNTRLTIPTGLGITKVRVYGMLRNSPKDTATWTSLIIGKNGSDAWDGNAAIRIETSHTDALAQISTAIVEVVDGDYFELRTQEDSDTTTTILEAWTHFGIEVVETTDTVPSLRTVVASLPAKWRGALVYSSVDDTGDYTTAKNMVFDTAQRDTDGIFDNAADSLIVPAGVSKVRLSANFRATAVAANDRNFFAITKAGSQNYVGVAMVRMAPGAATFHEGNIHTAVLDVQQGDEFNAFLQVGPAGPDTSVVIDKDNTWFQMEIVEFNSSTDAPVAYIAVPPEHKGATIKKSSDQTFTTATEDNVNWDAVDSDTTFDPGDGGPPQRFWFGVNWTFVDGDVSTGNDTITETAHGYQTGEGPIRLTTTGTLPTGLAVDTNYWIIRDGADTIQLATSRADALAGTQVDITGTTSGTHTVDQGEYFIVPAGIAKVQLQAGVQWESIDGGARNLWINRYVGGDLTLTNLHGQPRERKEADFRSNQNQSSAVLAVSEGDRFALRGQHAQGGDVDVLAATDTYFAIQVVEESRNITYPGVTVTPPWRGARIRLGTSPGAANLNTLTNIVWDTEDEDTDGFWEGVTNPARITIPSGLGIKRVTIEAVVHLTGITSGTNDHQIALYLNGASTGHNTRVAATESGTVSRALITVPDFPVSDADYFEIKTACAGTDTSVNIGTDSKVNLTVTETDENAFPPHQIDIFLDKAAYDTDAFPTTAGDPLYKMVASRRFTLGDNFAGSVAHSEVAATGAVTFNVNRNGTKIGEINFANTAQTATFTTTAATTEVFDVGDRLEIDTVANYQALDHIAISLWAWRS